MGAKEYKDFEGYDIEFFKDILEDLMYLNLELDSRKDKLNAYGLAVLAELRADKKFSTKNRQKRFEELDKLVTSLEDASNGAEGEKGVGGKDDTID